MKRLVLCISSVNLFCLSTCVSVIHSCFTPNMSFCLCLVALSKEKMWNCLFIIFSVYVDLVLSVWSLNTKWKRENVYFQLLYSQGKKKKSGKLTFDIYGFRLDVLTLPALITALSLTFYYITVNSSTLLLWASNAPLSAESVKVLRIQFSSVPALCGVD